MTPDLRSYDLCMCVSVKRIPMASMLCFQVPRPLQQSDFEIVLSTSCTSKVAAMEYNSKRQYDGQKTGEQVEVSVADILKLFAFFASNNRRNGSET